MPEIPLGTSSKNRRTTWTPNVRSVNMLVEQSVTNRFNGVDHIQRPGLVRFSTVGSGPIRGVFRQAGTFDGDFVVVSGEDLFRIDMSGSETLLGGVPGVLRTSTAATLTRVIVASDGLAYSTTGGAVTEIVMPDSRPVSSVAQLNGYFVLTELGSARFYWIAPGETDPDGLSFATTESSPGDILKVERVGDELWFFKEEGIEVWIPTGEADLPFQRVPGRNYDKGCRNRDSICRFDNSVAWVGNDGLVYRAAESPQRFSDNSLEEQIRKSDAASLRAWSFANDGHTLYCLTTNLGTWAFDALSSQWSEFQSHDRPFWRAHVGDTGDTFVVAGDDELGVVYRLDADASNDDGAPMTRIVTGGVPVVGQPERCDSFSLYATTGTAVDPELYAKVRISWSDDMETYADWQDVSIGRQGNYWRPVRINRLGSMRYPGRLFQVKVTDDVVVTVSAAAYNEPSR